MKIGVLADTHVSGNNPTLPSAVVDAVKGMDILLHAGDVGGISILQQLEPIAQTYAVFGEIDDAKVRKYLQEKARLARYRLLHGAARRAKARLAELSPKKRK